MTNYKLTRKFNEHLDVVKFIESELFFDLFDESNLEHAKNTILKVTTEELDIKSKPIVLVMNNLNGLLELNFSNESTLYSCNIL